MQLLEACAAFLEARDEILSHHKDKAAKFAFVHKGRAAFFNVDPLNGVGVAVQECLGAPAAPEAPAAAAETEAKKPGRPKKGAPPEAAPSAPPTAPEAPKEEWTKDKLRALARQVRDKHGLEVARSTIGCAIDDLADDKLAETAAKLTAKLAEAKSDL